MPYKDLEKRKAAQRRYDKKRAKNAEYKKKRKEY